MYEKKRSKVEKLISTNYVHLLDVSKALYVEVIMYSPASKLMVRRVTPLESIVLV